MYDQIRNNTNMFDVCTLLYLWMWIYVCVLFVKIVLYIDSVATWALLKSAKMLHLPTFTSDDRISN